MALIAPSIPETTPAAPTADELALLTLLSQGYTDDVVAHKLGLTGRTLRRRLRSAMDKLDASSRFQAGFKLAQSGWLEEPTDQGPRSIEA